MEVNRTKFTLAEVVGSIGRNELSPGQSIRMEKKSGGKGEISTWNKGHDWNPLKGYLEKKRFVKDLEKRIGEMLGDEKQGKLLTMEVGAYKRSFFKNSLPKLNSAQIEKLQLLIEASKMPERFKRSVDELGVMWSGSIQINDDSATEMLDDLKQTIGKRFNEIEGTGDSWRQIFEDNQKLRIHDKTDGESSSSHDMDETLQEEFSRFVPDEETQVNLAALLVQIQDVVEPMDKKLFEQEGMSFPDEDKDLDEKEFSFRLRNETSFFLSSQDDSFCVTFRSARHVNQVIYTEPDGAQQTVPLKAHSSVTKDVMFLISKEDVAQKKTDSLRIVWKPSVYGKFYPETQSAEPPAPIPPIEV